MSRTPSGMRQPRALVALGLVVTMCVCTGRSSGGTWSEIPLPPDTSFLGAITVTDEYIWISTATAASEYHGVFRAPIDSPGAWEPRGLVGSWVDAIFVHGEGDTDLLVRRGNYPKIMRSSNGGGSWVSVSSGLEVQDVHVLFWDRGFPGVLYAPAVGDDASGVYKSVVHYSTDWGESWGYWLSCVNCATYGLRLIAPFGQSGKAYAAGYSGFMYTYMLETADAGTTWTGLPFSSDYNPIDLVASPVLPNEVIFDDGPRLWYLTDETATATVLPSLFPQWGHQLVEIPEWDPLTLYVAGVLPNGTFGVTRTSYPFTTPELMSDGLPSSPYTYEWFNSVLRVHLVSARSSQTLYLAIRGKGLWRYEVGEITEVPVHDPKPHSQLAVEIVQHGRLFEFSFPGELPDRLEIYSVLGRLVDSPAVEGSRATWDGRDTNGDLAPSGIYYLRARNASRQTVHNLTVVR